MTLVGQPRTQGRMHACGTRLVVSKPWHWWRALIAYQKIEDALYIATSSHTRPNSARFLVSPPYTLTLCGASVWMADYVCLCLPVCPCLLVCCISCGVPVYFFVNVSLPVCNCLSNLRGLYPHRCIFLLLHPHHYPASVFTHTNHGLCSPFGHAIHLGSLH